MNDPERREDGVGREREAAGSASETTSGGGLNRVGCGCFGCSSIIFLAGCGLLVVILWAWLLPDWRVNNRYIASSCQVLDKKLESQLFDVPGGPNKGVKEESYRPALKIQYEASGRKIETWAYDGGIIYSPNRASQQAIIDSFQVGATYPCWYDPDRPDQAVLVRGYNRGAYLTLIFSIGLLVVGAVGMWQVRWISTNRPSPAPTVPRFIQSLQGLGVPRAPIDPARFGDPLALKTEWGPCKGGGGGNLQTHNLVEVDPDRLQFRATIQATLFAIPFLLIGLGVGVVAMVSIVTEMRLPTKNLTGFLALIVGLLFSAVGAYFLYSITTPIVFDRRMGLFWKGRKEPDEMATLEPLISGTHIKDIHALQLVSSFGGGGDRLPCHELNLVLTSGDRLHVIAYESGGRDRLRKDAAILAGFLKTPVWDAL